MESGQTPQLIDLSYSDTSRELDHDAFRAWINIPVVFDSGIEHILFVRYVNNHLRGRDALTCVVPSHEKFITNFTIEDLSDQTMHRVGQFATSLCGILGDIVSGEPEIKIHYMGESLEEVVKNWPMYERRKQAMDWLKNGKPITDV